MKKALPLILFLNLCGFNGFSQPKEPVPQPLTKLAVLPDAIKETSSLVYWDGYFWTHNDSNNPPFLFRLDTATGAVRKAIWVKNSYNYDWECLTQDESYFYIGDTGDNQHKRPRKRVYRISKALLIDTSVREVLADTIGFCFPEKPGENTNYDVEAMVCVNNYLHLFTKEADTTKHFTIPVHADTFTTARLVDEISVKGRITDACFDSGSNMLYLLIWSMRTNKYVWKVQTTGKDLHIKQVMDKKLLGTVLQYGQLEALCITPGGYFYLTNEKFQLFPPQLWRVKQ